MSPLYVFSVLHILLFQIIQGLGQECFLDDVQKTVGVCTPFRNCTFAIEQYKADVKPKICNGTLVCCPVQETAAQKKCANWRSYLHAPRYFGQEPLTDPMCPSLRGIITGDQDALRYKYCYSIALRYEETGKERYYCGGTLISEQYVLTAAHCIITHSGKPTAVLVGASTLDRPGSNFGDLVPISDWIVHPDYKSPLRYHDIALVKLNRKLELNPYFLPACLPLQAENKNVNAERVGWGTLDVNEHQDRNLESVNQTVFGRKECNRLYADVLDRNKSLPQGIRRSQLCAGDATISSGKDVCIGDSGGPLTVNEVYQDKELTCLFRVIGIASFEPTFCGFGKPNVFTKVQTYVNWIEKIAFADF